MKETCDYDSMTYSMGKGKWLIKMQRVNRVKIKTPGSVVAARILATASGDGHIGLLLSSKSAAVLNLAARNRADPWTFS
jgi:hypothetical protein